MGNSDIYTSQPVWRFLGKKYVHIFRRERERRNQKKQIRCILCSDSSFSLTKCQHGRDIVLQLVICHKCVTILYNNIELKSPPLEEIVQSCYGKCPNCEKKLASLPKRVQVILFTRQINQTHLNQRIEDKKRDARNQGNAKENEIQAPLL